MIYLIYGEGEFLVRRKLEQFRSKFIKSGHDLSNLIELDGAGLRLDEFRTAVFAAPLIAQKKLIIIKNFLMHHGTSDLAAAIEKSLPDVPEDVVLVFAEAGAVPASKLMKALNQPKAAVRYDKPNPVKVKAFIDAETAGLSGGIEPAAKELLAQIFETDIEGLANEIAKLVNFDPHISVNSIKKLTFNKSSARIFELLDAFTAHDRQKTYLTLKNLISSGAAPMSVLYMLIKHYENLICAKEMFIEGKNAADIASAAGIHPYAAKKALGAAQLLDLEEIKNAYMELVGLEIKIRTGELAAIDALERFILKQSLMRLPV